jgi:hypothetical protein
VDKTPRTKSLRKVEADAIAVTRTTPIGQAAHDVNAVREVVPTRQVNPHSPQLRTKVPPRAAGATAPIHHARSRHRSNPHPPGKVSVSAP